MLYAEEILKIEATVVVLPETLLLMTPTPISMLITPPRDVENATQLASLAYAMLWKGYYGDEIVCC